MLPDPSFGRCWTRTPPGREILNFKLQYGDRCPDDAYDPKKERAYLVFDADKRSNRPAMTPLRIDTSLELLKDGPLVSSWWFTFMQWNQWPGADGVWRPPPFSLDLKVEGGKEFLVARARHLNAAGQVAAVDVATMPFERKRYQLGIDFVCSNGGEGGFCQLSVNGWVIGNYDGPTGYPGRDVYAAVGLYRATPRNKADSQTVMYEGFHEG